MTERVIALLKENPMVADYRLNTVKTESYRGHRRMTVSCGDVTFAYVDDKLPASFRAGIIGCEGRNWFYDFKIDSGPTKAVKR